MTELAWSGSSRFCGGFYSGSTLFHLFSLFFDCPFLLFCLQGLFFFLFLDDADGWLDMADEVWFCLLKNEFFSLKFWNCNLLAEFIEELFVYIFFG